MASILIQTALWKLMMWLKWYMPLLNYRHKRWWKTLLCVHNLGIYKQGGQESKEQKGKFTRNQYLNKIILIPLILINSSLDKFNPGSDKKTTNRIGHLPYTE